MILNDCTHCFAVPGEHNIIDMAHPVTGLSIHWGQNLEQIQKRHPGARLYAWDEWKAEKFERQNTPLVWTEITQEQYDEWLCCLPPAKWEQGKGFLVGEPSDHCVNTGKPRFQACLHKHGKYLASSRPLTVKEFDSI